MPDERDTLLILVEPGCLAHEHEIGVRTPEPKTTCVRPAASAHFVHVAVCSAYSLSAAARSTASIGRVYARPDATARRYPQPQEPPQQPPLARGAEGATHTAAPCTAKVENCFKTFPRRTRGRRRLGRPSGRALEVRFALHTGVLVDRHVPSLASRSRGVAAHPLLPSAARYPETGLEQSMIERIRVVGAGGRVGTAVSAPRPARRASTPTSPSSSSSCVPDRAIAEVAGATRPGPWVAHVSGATPLSALDPHARRFGMHPLQSFSKTRGPEQLDGAWAAVSAESDEARTTGFWLAETLGLRPFALADDARAAYHAGAAVASNYLVTLRGCRLAPRKRRCSRPSSRSCAA